jgi:trk system potassium uptake protein TrkA
MAQEIAVIGLGKFGLYFATILMDLGLEVLGIDKNEEHVQKARNLLSQVYQADATNQEALEQIGLSDVSHVLISVGDSIAASSMIAMYAKEMGIEQVWVKAVNHDHERLLRKLQVDEVIIPEQMAAVRLASKVAIPGFLQYARFDPNVSFQKLTVKRWAGKTLRELELTKRRNVHVISVKKHDSEEYEYQMDPDYPFQEGDTVIVLRQTNDMVPLKP